MTVETPVRLPPTSGTLRELYLKSGNQCAFTACAQALFTADGDWVANVCHIEGAMPGGERFNAAMSNEDRRKPSNLILLCATHHVVTNDENVYTTPVMQHLKAKHEGKFADVIGKIREQVVDHTNASNPVLPTNLKRLYTTMRWPYVENDVDEIGMLKILHKVARSLKQVPIPSRQLFTVLLRRSQKVQGAWLTSTAEVMSAMDMDSESLRGHYSTLTRFGFVDEGWPDDFGVPRVRIPSEDEWELWPDLRKFCAKTGCDLDLMTEDMDFSTLAG